MNLKNLLSEKKKSILERWFDLILTTYPPETLQFLKSQKDRFSNPVGSTIYQGIEGLFDQVFHEDKPEKIPTFLDNIIRIRAIQDFTASQSVSFIFQLKEVIRDELKDKMGEKGFSEELLALESEIDDLALLSFDIFMKCREQVYELKANEVKNMTYSLLKRANLICEIEKFQSAQKADNYNIDQLKEER